MKREMRGNVPRRVPTLRPSDIQKMKEARNHQREALLKYQKLQRLNRAAAEEWPQEVKDAIAKVTGMTFDDFLAKVLKEMKLLEVEDNSDADKVHAREP